MTPAPRILSKSEFARHIGVSRQRVGQMVAAGLIGADAIEGRGRDAKVIVARAIEQIARKRDIGQALGNGLMTRLEFQPPAADTGKPLSDDADREPRPTTVDDEIKAERLQAERRRNRIAAQEEAVRVGRLVDVASAKASMATLAQAVDDENASMLADFASALSSQFGLPQRDLLHLLRRIRTEKKADAADRARRRAASLPEHVNIIVEEPGEQ